MDGRRGGVARANEVLAPEVVPTPTSILDLLSWSGWACRAAHNQLGEWSLSGWRLYTVDASQQLFDRIPALGGEIESKGCQWWRKVRGFWNVVYSGHADVVGYAVPAFVESEDRTEGRLVVGCDERRRR